MDFGAYSICPVQCMATVAKGQAGGKLGEVLYHLKAGCGKLQMCAVGPKAAETTKESDM